MEKKTKTPKIKLKIAYPHKAEEEQSVDFIVVPAFEGDIGVMYGHTPFISSLRQGELIIRNNGSDKIINVKKGFVEVKENLTTLLIKE